jgi:mono/diheme cytochrome c family protein
MAATRCTVSQCWWGNLLRRSNHERGASPPRARFRKGRATALLALCVLVFGSPASLAQTSFTPRDETPEEFAAGAGRDETFYACTACHNFKLVAAQGLDRAGWDDSLNLMVRKHNMPPLDAKDRETVLNYLATAYPPRAAARGRGWQNPFSKK